MADENLHPFEGCLMKFTNVFQRWQYRFFCLDPVRGVLEYYVTENGPKEGAPRGVAHLRNATVLPSSDDEVTFTVTFRGGETFKLRARDSRERKLWTDRLRVASFFAPSTDQHVGVVESGLTDAASNLAISSENNSAFASTNSTNALAPSVSTASNSKRSVNAAVGRSSLKTGERVAALAAVSASKVAPEQHQAISTTDDPFLDAQTRIRVVRDQRNEIVAALSCFPRHGSSSTSINPSDQHYQQEDVRNFDRNSRQLLSLQACSLAAIESVEQCLKCLQQPASSSLHQYNAQKSRLQVHQTTTATSVGTRSRSSTRSVSPAAQGKLADVDSMGNLPAKAAQTLQSSVQSVTRHLSHVSNESGGAATRRRSPGHTTAGGGAIYERRSSNKNARASTTARKTETGSGAAVSAQQHATPSTLQQEDSDTSFENFYGRTLRKAGAEDPVLAEHSADDDGAEHFVVAAGDRSPPSLIPNRAATPRDSDSNQGAISSMPTSVAAFDASPRRSGQQPQNDVFFTPSSIADDTAAPAPAGAERQIATTDSSPPQQHSGPQFSYLLRDRNEDEEISDSEANKLEEDLGSVESQKSVIMHLLGQLRIGMDLTKVVLPTFILERRSLLEMFADYMAHAHMLLRVTDLESPRDRMIAVLEWYLTSFHACRKGSIAKKPYNPVIGEQFHCSWHVPRAKIQQSASEFLQSVHKSPKLNRSVAASSAVDGRDFVTVRYCGEQVSHHPPISAFFIECAEKGLQANAAIYTKSKFMGLSIGVSMVGNCSLFLRHHDEEYTFGLPSAYARSILTVPWTELGGKLEIDCQKSGMVSEINFHTKPFYGGKLHRVTAEVRDRRQNKLLCTVEGEWDKFFKFTFNNEQKTTKQIDVDTLELMHKRVLPIDKQSPIESRRLWRHVTQNLESGDIAAATEYKKALEDRQRSEEKPRREQGIKYDPKYFKEVGEVDYRFRDLLRP